MNFKFLIVALALATTVSCVDQSTYFSDACAWRDALQAQLKLLTPNGQQIFTQILLDLQNLMGAAVQPTFDSLSVKYGAQMQALNASSDAANLRTVGAALGWKSGLTRGLGLLQDSCARQTTIRSAVAAMQPENQVVVKAALAEVKAGLMSIYNPVRSIVQLKDKYLFDALLASENKDTLKALKGLFA